MSALARFFLLQGKQVFGYDLNATEITSQLIKEGAHIHFEEDISKIPAPIDMVVYTPAIPLEHKEYQYFINRKIPLLKRSEVLGMICAAHPTIAIAGTHGKTTTTAMVTKLMMRRLDDEMIKGEGKKGEKEKGEGKYPPLAGAGGGKSPSNFEGVDREARRGSLYKPLIFKSKIVFVGKY